MRRAVLALGCLLSLGAVSCGPSRRPVYYSAPEPDERIGSLAVYYPDGADTAPLGSAVRFYLAAWEADNRRAAPQADLYIWPGEGVDVGLGGGFAGYTRPGRIDAAAGRDLSVWPLYHELTHLGEVLPPHPASQAEWDAVDARQRELVAALLAARAEER